MRHISWTAPVALVAVCGANPALGEESAEAVGTAALAEITVTATKTGAKDLQEIPLAISAFAGDAILKAGISGIEGVAALTPGLNFTANGPWAIPSIRGIGTNNTFVGGDPSVTLQVDGVYMGRPSQASTDLMDVERVEVLRGPQGTLYGRNATGGAINVVTRAPSNALEAEIRASLGTENTNSVEGRVNVPLATDTLALSIAGRTASHDAYVTNLAPNQSDLWTNESEAIRAKLRWTPADNVDVTLAGDYTHDQGHHNWYSARLATPDNPLGSGTFDGLDIPDIHQAAFNEPQYMKSTFWGVSLTATADVGNVLLTSISAYRSQDLNADFDIDMSAAQLVHTASFPETGYQYSQEVNLSGTSGALEWITGVFLYHEDATSYYNLRFYEDLIGVNALQTSGNNTTTDSVAVFAQGTYALNDRLSMTLGARYTSDRKRSNVIAGYEEFPSGFPSDLTVTAANTAETPNYASWAQTTPKLGLEFKATPDLLLYGSVTRGYKSGGFNLTGGPAYDPETVWAYEAGAKTTLASGRAVLNTAVFYYDYEGYQVNQFIGTGQEYVSNSDKAESLGLEVEGTVNVTETLVIGGNVALLKSKYKDPEFFTTDNVTHTQVSADGNDLNDAPRLSGTLFGEYQWKFEQSSLLLHGEVVHKDKVYYHPSNNSVEVSAAHTLVNAALTYASDDRRWEFSIIGRNLLDEDYLTGAATFVVIGGRPGEPRIISGALTYRF